MPDSHQSEVPEHDCNELSLLLDAVLCDSATEETALRLNQLLENNETLQSLAVTRLFDDALLGEELSMQVEIAELQRDATTLLDSMEAGDCESCSGDTDAVLPKRTNSPSLLQRLATLPTRSLAGLAAAMLIGMTVGLLMREPETQNHSLVEAATETPVRMISATGCIWDELGEQAVPVVGKPCRRGSSIRLEEGIAEFAYEHSGDSRVVLEVEGPADLLFAEDNILHVRSGTVTVDGRGANSPYFVNLPSGRLVVPANSHAGVVVDKHQSEIHAFESELQFNAVDDRIDRISESSTFISPNEAARFSRPGDGDSRTTLFHAEQAKFAVMQSMSADELSIDDTYRSEILAAKPDVYWQFEATEGAMPNRGIHPGMSGIVEGAVASRRFTGNNAAEFGLGSQAGRIISEDTWPSKSLEEYSVELWVKPSHLHGGTVVGLIAGALPEGRWEHGFLLCARGPKKFSDRQGPSGSFRAVHRSPPSGNFREGTAIWTKDSYRPRFWHYLVLTKTEDRLRMYLNGEVVSNVKDKTALVPGQRVLLGTLYPDSPDRRAERRFVGQIDELALYGRALTQEEIRRHYEFGVRKASDDHST